MDKKEYIKNTLHWLITLLEAKNIPYVITGGFWAHLYGATRDINDIDIDIHESDFEKILPEIKAYITFGPWRYIDERWDLQIITLNYHGQEIDIGSADRCTIFDDISQTWKIFSSNLKEYTPIVYEWISLRVMLPQEMIAYKSLLSGEHQKTDIIALKNYIQALWPL